MFDYYESFTDNKVQYLSEVGGYVHVFLNAADRLAENEALNPDYLGISPEPCTPNEAGISIEAIKHFAGKIPILCICLGHQSIGQAFGGEIIRAEQIMHGKTSPIHHANIGIFEGLTNPYQATRYHSLVINRKGFPDCLEITAWTQNPDGKIGRASCRERV